jgi:hypothetical protein
MILLLACTGATEPEAETSAGAAFTGLPSLTGADLSCAGGGQRWRVSGRGVAELELHLFGVLGSPEPDTGFDDTGHGDSGDTGTPSVTVDELHPVPLEDQDPAGWWATYALDLDYAPEQPGIGHSAVSCAEVETELQWSLTLRGDGQDLDCLGTCP